jgi:flagellar protein FlaG
MDIDSIKGVPVSGGAARARGELLRQPQISSDAGGNRQLPVQSPAQARAPMEAAVSSIQEFAQSIQRNLNFSLDDSTGRVVVKVTDSVSGEVIRQIPSEDALRLAESLDEVRSLLFKAEA